MLPLVLSSALILAATAGLGLAWHRLARAGVPLLRTTLAHGEASEMVGWRRWRRRWAICVIVALLLLGPSSTAAQWVTTWAPLGPDAMAYVHGAPAAVVCVAVAVFGWRRGRAPSAMTARQTTPERRAVTCWLGSAAAGLVLPLLATAGAPVSAGGPWPVTQPDSLSESVLRPGWTSAWCTWLLAVLLVAATLWAVRRLAVSADGELATACSLTDVRIVLKLGSAPLLGGAGSLGLAASVTLLGVGGAAGALGVAVSVCAIVLLALSVVFGVDALLDAITEPRLLRSRAAVSPATEVQPGIR